MWIGGGFILAKTIQSPLSGLHELTGKSGSSTISWFSGSDLACKSIAGHLWSTDHLKEILSVKWNKKLNYLPGNLQNINSQIFLP